MNTTTHQTYHRGNQLLLAIGGITGIAGLFLPFIYGVSPMNAITIDGLERAGFPFFLSILIFAAAIRWMMSGAFSITERIVAYAVSVGAACVTISQIIGDGWKADVQAWVARGVSSTILALGVCVIIWNVRTKRGKEFNHIIALQATYLAHIMLFLIACFENWQVGAYCVLVAAMVTLLQGILMANQSQRQHGQLQLMGTGCESSGEK